MPISDTPLTDAIRRTATTWGVHGSAERLHGGEESAAYRVGDRVVRIGPAWRSTVEAEWCHTIARHAAVAVPEAVAPLPTPEGTTVVRVEGRPVSVWPHVSGEWGDDAHWAQAARLLARLHRALADVRMPPRPAPASQDLGAASDLADPELDRWLATFAETHPRRHPLHGDYYAGNTLDRGGRLVAVLDWDEAFVGPPEQEVAAAALEWGDDCATDLVPAREFLAAYLEAGGTARPLDDRALAQLIRHKLRREAAYFAEEARRGAVHDEAGLDYHRRRIEAFHRLGAVIRTGY